ncbi:hypothetical protein [Roseateles sp. L2-2]|uniref:hypothetical protein n=1 Tax=Roseateles TaxID=93681 RepID=UPI003D367A65
MRASVPIQISRFVDDHEPGFIECVLVDAFGKSHVFIEKVPVVTTEDLRSTSTYPRPGTLDGEIVAGWIDHSGRALMRIDTERPWNVESAEGLTQFVVANRDARASGSPEMSKKKSEGAERRMPPASKDFVVYTLSGLLSASKRVEYRQKCREQALHLLRFIRDNGLNDAALPSEPIDDLVIKASDLTREGLATMREGLRQWVSAQDRGGASNDMAILDAALAKVRHNGGDHGVKS